MQSSKRQDVDVFQPYLTPPAEYPDPSFTYTQSSTVEGASSSASLSTRISSVLDMNHGDFVMEEILDSTSSLCLPPTSSEKPKLCSDLYADPTNVCSISTTFHIELVPAPDLVLLSSDKVFFCVHLETVHRHCPEALQSFLDASSSQRSSYLANPVVLNCPSAELNIILHALYNMSLEAYRPGPDTVAAALDFMPVLGITVKLVVYPECALYQYILSYTPHQPLKVYAMAAHHDVHALAVHASSYLLNLNILTVSEEASDRMGPLYLLKLVGLHAARFEALKAGLLVSSPTHLPAEDDRCSFSQQQQAKQIWALFCAEPLWHTRPIDSAVQAMEETLLPMMEDITCTECRLTLRRMVASVRSLWISVPALCEKGARMCGIKVSIPVIVIWEWDAAFGGV